MFRRVATIAASAALLLASACSSKDESGKVTAAASSTTTAASGSPATQPTVTSTGASGAPSSAAAPTTAPAPTGKDRSAPIPLGTEAKVGDRWTVKVLAFVADAWPAVKQANQFNKPAADRSSGRASDGSSRRCASPAWPTPPTSRPRAASV